MDLNDTEIKLYPHQVESILNMEKLEREKKVTMDNTTITTKLGINSDITGYGKTISMIGLIIRDKMEWDMNCDYIDEEITRYSSGMLNRRKTFSLKKLNSTLILSSPSISKQWMEELKKTNLKSCCITTTLKANTIDVNDYDVIVTVPNFIRALSYRYLNMVWKRFIYDEPSNVALPLNVQIYAGFTWFLTATPELISMFQRKRRNAFMKAISNDLYYFMNWIIVKNDDDFVRSSFIMPETKFFEYVCYNNVYKILNSVIDDRIKKIIETGNIADAIIQLGGRSTSNIFEAVKNNHLIELKNIESKIQISEMKGEDDRKIELELKKNNVLKKMKDLEIRIKTVLNGKCCICFEDLNKPVMEPNCNNIFCGSCLLSWLKDKKTCPLCRTEIDIKKLIYIESKNDEKNDEYKIKNPPTKEEQILRLIEQNPSGKFIIYSDDDCSFKVIRNFLETNKINYFELKGGTNTRYNSIQKFKKQKNDRYIGFLNSIKDCSGINLQETTDIIFYHEVNEHVRTQVIGRANRIGRIEPLNVHQLFFEK